MTPIVTVITEDYLVGAIALRNSWRLNSPDGFSFHLIAYGDDAFRRELERLGFDPIMNPDIGANLPLVWSATHWSEKKRATPNPAMYARLLIPDLFPDHEKTIYIDADAIILKPMDVWLEHDMGEHPCGGTASWAAISKEVIGLDRPYAGIMSAVIVFNHEWWKKKDILNRCRKAMNAEKYQFKTVVQAVLQYVLDKDWYNFPQHYHVQGQHPGPFDSAYVMHWAGLNPWDSVPVNMRSPRRMAAIEMWKRYA